MTEEDGAVIEAMQVHGGSFVSALGYAAARADAGNLAIIKTAFADYWEQYRELARLRAVKPTLPPAPSDLPPKFWEPQ